MLRPYGQSALDFFKLWSDKSYYFYKPANCFLAYRVGNNFALALADPVGPEDRVEETVRGFSEFLWIERLRSFLPGAAKIYLATYPAPNMPHGYVEARSHSFDSGGGSRPPASVRNALTNLSNCSSNLLLSVSHPVKSAASRALTSVAMPLCHCPLKR